MKHDKILPINHLKEADSFPFFIVGCGRSGTTLLRTMLNHHPEIAIPLESLFMIDYLRADSSQPISQLKNLLCRDHEFARWDMPVTLSDFQYCKSASELIDRIHRLYLKKTGKKRWGQKTPRFIRYGGLLKKHYPQARFIHIIRDARAVVNSLINSRLHRSNAYYAANRWKHDMEHGIELKKKYPDDVLEISYEALVLSPDKILHEVCQFIKVPYFPEMLEYHRTGTSEYLDFVGQIHQNLNQPLRADRISKWEEDLSQEEISLVEYLCENAMQYAGYSLIKAPMQPKTRYIQKLVLQRYWGISHQILDRLFNYTRPFLSFIWRKIRLGLFWGDFKDFNI